MPTFHDHTIIKPFIMPSCMSIKPIICSKIQVFGDGKTYQNVQVNLYEEFIHLATQIEGNKTHWRIKLQFDLTFQFLFQNRKQNINQTQNYSIKLEKNQKWLQLRNFDQEKDLPIWRQNLAKKLNQRGFRELFHPIKKLGQGGFAAVYLALNRQDQKEYAIKAFSKKQVYAENLGKEGLVNEIAIMRKFNHQNLMKLIGVYQSQNSIYVCVEYLAGGQLQDLIKARHQFSSVEIATIMRDLLQGLEQLHSRNIMHRDIKPQNVIFRKHDSEKGHIGCVITDFGLAQNASNQKFMFPRCGTPGYVAPQIANLKECYAKYTTACDLFSLGIIFHMLILSRSPFPGKTYDQVMGQNRACKINFNSFEYLSLQSAELNLLKGLIEKDPKKRLTATQALNHQYFKMKFQIIKAESKQNEKPIEESSNQIHENATLSAIVKKGNKTSIECDSPLMLSRNINRKRHSALRGDSCLKFKMNINSQRGKSKQDIQIESPLLSKPFGPRLTESRFKKMAVDNS